jgi:formamidopyrimidine-DNA glycosylase
MPEGPEVRRMSEGLSKRVSGKMLTEATILGGKWLKTPIKGLDILQSRLNETPQKIEWVRVNGKFIYAQLGEDLFMWNSLGMSGGWRDLRGKHSHFVFSFSDGTEVFFEDVRRFGNIEFMDQAKLFSKLSKVGPDMLNRDVPYDEFYSRISKNPNKNICKILMDQKILAGVGNYIKSEALYRAKISPRLNVGEIPQEKLEDLCYWIKSICRKSYEQGGATLATYTDMDNNHGDFVFSFNVYRKEYDPLGNRVIHETTPDDRMTHWVPEIQN